MANQRDKGLDKVTIRIFEGDKEKLMALFPGIGYNRPLRLLIRNFIKGVEEKAQRKLQRRVDGPSITIDVEQVMMDAKEDESDDE